MKVLIQYFHGFLHKRTERLNLVSQNCTLYELFEGIAKQLGHPMDKIDIVHRNQIISYKEDNKNKYISEFDIQENNLLIIEFQETEEQKLQKKNQKLKTKLLAKITQKNQKLSDIKEEEKLDITNMQGSLTLSNSSDDQKQFSYQYNMQKIFNNQLEKVIIYTKNNELQKIQNIIQELTSLNINENISQQLVNELSQGGWNAFHYAVYLDYQDIVQYFITLKVDLNITTSDGWSPLQLAAKKNHCSLIKILLDSKTCNVNQITNKGIALKFAIKENNHKLIQLLLSHGADLYIKVNGQNLITNIPENYKELLQNNDVQEQQSQSVPQKPPTFYGNLSSQGKLYTLSLRYYMVSPFEGTIIKYDKEENCPMKPKEIIPLKDITQVKKIIKRNWYMKNELYYFEFKYNTRNFVLACETIEARDQWIKYIAKAILYSKFKENNNLEDIESEEKLCIQDSYNYPTQKLSIHKQSQISNDSMGKFDIEKSDEQKNIQFDFLGGTSPMSPQLPEIQYQQKGETIQMSISEEEKEDTKPSKEISPQEQVVDLNNLDNTKFDLQDIEAMDVNFASFNIIKILGQGSFGKVFLAKHIKNQNIYAIKALKKRNLILKKQLKYAITEANVLKICSHPFVINLHYAFQTPNYLYLVLDYCKGGDLSYHLAERFRFDEKSVQFYISELVLAINHIHQKDVIYRDLKPENILLNSDGHIKVADFGLSKDNVGDSDTTRSFCGSPAYLSPEMLNKQGTGKEADYYGIGTVMFELLTGDPPYYNDDMELMYLQIQKDDLKYPSYISAEAKSLMQGLLERDPKKRFGLQQIQKHSFFRNIDWEDVANKRLKPPIVNYSIDQDELNYLNSDYIFQDYDYNENNKKVNRVINFSFRKI